MAPGAWILRQALEGVATADIEVEGGLLHLVGEPGATLTIRRMLERLAAGVPLPQLAQQAGIPEQMMYDALMRLAAAASSPAATPPPRCLHGGHPGMCPFAGCEHYAPDGPREERWAFAPGVTEADIAAAVAENTAVHTRAPGSASPIHLVVERVMEQRQAGVVPLPLEDRLPGPP